MAINPASPIGYNSGIKTLLQNDWVTGDYVAILLNSSYTPDITHSTYNDVSANLVATSQVALSGKAINNTPASNSETDLDASDVTIPNSLSGKYMAVLKWNGSSLQLTDELVFYIDLDDGGSSNVAIDAPIVFQSKGIGTFTW